MSETLSQKDIDALLNGVETAIAPATEPVLYNFVRPPRVSKDRRATLEAVHTRFALSLQALLTSRLRTTVDVVVESVEQVGFSEFVLSLGTPCAAFEFKLGDPLGAHGVIDLGNPVAFHLVDRLFGGPGEPETVERPLTTLEQTVVRNVVERTLALLRDAWEDQLQIHPELVGFESNPEMLQIVNPEDSVLVANLTIRSGAPIGVLSVCLPLASFEPFLQERSTARPQGNETRADRVTNRPLMESTLQHAGLTVTARLPILRLTAREILGLQVGQVIETDHAPDAPVELHVNGRLRFRATLGQMRRRLGVRVVDKVSAPTVDRSARTTQGRVS